MDLKGKKILGIDLETTGLDVEKGHKIIEYAGLEYVDGVRTGGMTLRFDPERSIDAKAQDIHGISYTELSRCPKFRDAAMIIAEQMEDADIIVIHNAGFDAPFIAAELEAAGVPYDRIVTPFCTKENARWATPDGKYPKLGELCFALEVDYDPSKAHVAEYDVSVMMQCFFRGVELGFFKPNAPVRK